MNEALVDLLQKLTGHAQARLRMMRLASTDDTIKAALALEIANLDDLLDKARHEQKGGV